MQDKGVELRSFERRRENQASIVLSGRCNIQVFQHGKLVIHSRDELLQTWNRLLKVYAPHTIATLEGEHYSFFVLCCEIMIFVIVVNDEWKRRGMC